MNSIVYYEHEKSLFSVIYGFEPALWLGYSSASEWKVYTMAEFVLLQQYIQDLVATNIRLQLKGYNFIVVQNYTQIFSSKRKLIYLTIWHCYKGNEGSYFIVKADFRIKSLTLSRIKM